MEWYDIYLAFLWVGKQALAIMNWFSAEQIVAVVLTALTVIAVVLYEPKKRRIVPWLNLVDNNERKEDVPEPEQDEDVWREVHIEPFMDKTQYQKILDSPIVSNQPHIIAQIKYERRSEQSKTNDQIDALKARKTDFIARKEEFVGNDKEMLDEYQNRLDVFDAQINKLYHAEKINSIIDSYNNPVIATTTTAHTPTRKVLGERKFVPDEQYRKYIHSDLWRKRSKAYKEQLSGKCEQCGKDVGVKGLQVHHISYCENLARDDNESFWAGLCKECHKEYRRTTMNDKAEKKTEV